MMVRAKPLFVAVLGLVVIAAGFLGLRMARPLTHDPSPSAAVPAEPLPSTPVAPTAAPFPAVPQNADPRAEREALLAEMREGYARAAPDAPNLLDLLAARFPA